jgi:hypothetical protein
MHLTLDQAIEIYARANGARYGRRTLATAKDLRGHGDDDGASVWERVAENVISTNFRPAPTGNADHQTH